MKEKLRRFFAGRYGNDQFNQCLTWTALAVLILSMCLTGVANGIPSSILWYLSIIALVYSIVRSFSKNIYKRQAENAVYLKKTAGIRGWFRMRKQRFRDRKTYKYLTCPDCRAQLRVPKGKGKLRVTCKKCGRQFEAKS